jgi:hypothetical protein
MPSSLSRYWPGRWKPPVWRNASPNAKADAIATLIERKPACIGIRSRVSAAS